MPSINKAIIIGNLGRDPESRQSQGGIAITTFSVATTRAYKDSNGNVVKETEWHRVSTFARLAEIARDYLYKGGLVYIEGRLRTRKYQDKDGVEKYTTEIIAETLQMLGGKGAQTEQSEQDAGTAQQRPAPTQAAQREPEIAEEEVPF